MDDESGELTENDDVTCLTRGGVSSSQSSRKCFIPHPLFHFLWLKPTFSTNPSHHKLSSCLKTEST